MSRCLTPHLVKNKGPSGMAFMTVPCGSCPVCHKKRVDHWVFRLRQEEKIHFMSRFITLTYADENLPVTSDGEITLFKPDLQNFFKRLRKNTGCKSIRYYACGEYGTRTARPHYHAIVFDADDDNIVRSWPHGMVHLGDVSKSSIAYCAKYISKSNRKFDTKQSEFSLMSKKMGLNFLTPEMQKYLVNDGDPRNYITLEGGSKTSLPRYFRDKVFNENEKLKIQIQNLKLDADLFDKLMRKYGDLESLNRQQFYYVKMEINKYNKLQKLKRDKI